MASTGVVVAKQSFAVGSTVVRKGTTFRKGHSITEGREDMFEPFEPDHDIEQATAAPGEKRSTRIRRESKPDTAETTEEPEESTEGSTDTTDYSEMKQPQLKSLLDERGIEYPSGVVSNADLIALLESKPETTE